MDEPRPITDPALMIDGFKVFEKPKGGWRAVHKENPDVVIEHERWEILRARCIGARIRLHLFALWGVTSWSEALANEHHHIGAGS